MTMPISAFSGKTAARLPLHSVKQKVNSTIAKQTPAVMSAASLALELTAMSFINKTGNDSKTMYLGGHWETHIPQDASDYSYQVWVEDPEPLSQDYIHSSGDGYTPWEDD